MNKEKKKVIITIIMIVSIITFFFVSKNMLNKNQKPLPEVKLNNKIDKEKAMAIMISEDGNKYTEYEGETWPGSEYVYSRSECVDNNGSVVEGIVTFDNKTRKVSIKSKGTIYCTLYFDYKGTGEKELPYKIRYIDDLVDLQEAVNKGETYTGKYFELEKDLDFNQESDYKDYQSKDYGDINGNSQDEELKTELTSGNGWKPIGDSKENPFQGIFDGKNYTIANIYIHNTVKEESVIGLFGYIKNGTIKNLKVSGEMTTTLMNDIGGIVGNIDGTTIDTCESNVKITSDIGRYSLGGITGGAVGEKSTIKNCINRGNITNGNNTAGIIAVLDSSQITIENCYNYGEITNNLGDNTGGILARDTNIGDMTTITNSVNIGVVVSNIEEEKTTNTGGLVGHIAGSIIINKSHNSGEVRNDRTTYTKTLDISLGGLVGVIDGNDKNTNTITNSYNEGHLVAGNRIGGIIGFNVNKAITIIDNCYNKGIVESQITTSTNQTAVSGIVGYNNTSKLYILNSYNEGDISSIRSAQGIAYTDNGSTTNIINFYNIGNINGGTTTAGIFVVASGTSNGIVNNIKLNNVYNLGNITGSNAYDLGYRIGTTAPVEITNSYYEENKKGTNISNIDGTPLALNDIKNQNFINTLNNNMYQINLSKIDSILKEYKLKGWELGSDGYPAFAKEVEDLSGNGRNGISFAVDWTKDGITTSNDIKTGFVYMGMENYDFDKDLSFVTRVKFNKVDVTQEFMNNFEGAGAGFALIDSKVRFGIFNKDLSTPSYVYTNLSNIIIKPNEWYTIVGTYDNKEIKIFINGEKDISASTTGGIKPSPAFMALGQNPYTNLTTIVNPSYTTFSDALIFDRALSEEEIRENYSNVPNPIDKDKLLLWYKF